MANGAFVGKQGGVRVSPNGGAYVSNASGQCAGKCDCTATGWPSGTGFLVGTPCPGELTPGKPVAVSIASIAAYLTATYGNANPPNVTCVVASASTNVGPVCVQFTPSSTQVATAPTSTYYIASPGFRETCCNCRAACVWPVGPDVLANQGTAVALSLPSKPCCYPSLLNGDTVRNVGAYTFTSYYDLGPDGHQTDVYTYSWDVTLVVGGAAVVVNGTHRKFGVFQDTVGGSGVPFDTTESVSFFLSLPPYVTISSQAVQRFGQFDRELGSVIARLSGQRASPDTDNATGSYTQTCSSIDFSLNWSFGNTTYTLVGNEAWTFNNQRSCDQGCGGAAALLAIAGTTGSLDGCDGCGAIAALDRVASRD